MIQLDYKKFVIACIVILIMWGSLLTFWYIKADEVTKDPCSVCAKKMGETIRCSPATNYDIFRDYYPNGSIYTKENEFTLNFTGK